MSIIDTLLNKSYSTKKEKEECKQLMDIFFKIQDVNERQHILNKALTLDPFNSNLLVQYGLQSIFSQNKIQEYYGYFMLERAFETNPPIPIDCYQGRWIASLIGRYNHLHHKYKTSLKFFDLANSSKYNPDDTNKVQLTTCITSFPTSVKDAANIIKTYNENIDGLLKKKNISLTLTDNIDYNFIMLSAFNFELYYEANIKECMQKYYLLTLKIFPELNYVSSLIKNIRQSVPYKLGIVSAFFVNNHSVSSDFRGVIERLPEDLFDITFIYLVENKTNEEFIYHNKKHIIIETYNNTNWLKNARQQIEERQFDLLYYLDSTMSSVVQRTMMSKLAPKQALSHGHPVTSGINKDIMNYFISWGEAEIDTAQVHYTEKLMLLRKGYMHQYYEHRVNNDGISNISGKSYKDISRETFKQYITSDGNWYVCMQKPFKLHPEFDIMLEKIALTDINAKIILHDIDEQENKSVFLKRYKKFINKVYFIPALPHHELIGLYNVSDVILDSYYAGGCTTTREALEIGAPVVTLPGKYLGGRWSLAYYNIIGVTELIAATKDEYVKIALKCGIDKEYNNLIKEKILQNINKIFYSEEAVNSWIQIFKEIIED